MLSLNRKYSSPTSTDAPVAMNMAGAVNWLSTNTPSWTRAISLSPSRKESEPPMKGVHVNPAYCTALRSGKAGGEKHQVPLECVADRLVPLTSTRTRKDNDRTTGRPWTTRKEQRDKLTYSVTSLRYGTYDEWAQTDIERDDSVDFAVFYICCHRSVLYVGDCLV